MSGRDLERALDVTAVLAEVTSWRDVRDSAMPALAGLVEADTVVFHDVDLDRGAELSLFWPPAGFSLSDFVGYAEHFPRHPVVTRYDDVVRTGGVRLSEVIAPERWRRTDAYREVFAGLGLVDQIVCVVNSSGRSMQAVSVIRDGTFGPGEQETLSSVSRQLRAALFRAQAAPSNTVGLRTVPTPQFAPMTTTPVPQPDGLTQREREVLLVASTGCTSAAASRRLGISARTVEKHLQNIHRKLEVESTLEAVQRIAHYRRGAGR